MIFKICKTMEQLLGATIMNQITIAWQQRLPHANNRVEIGTDPLRESVKKVGLSWGKPLIHDNRLHGVEDIVLVVQRVYVWNVARIENVVQILSIINSV